MEKMKKADENVRLQFIRIILIIFFKKMKIVFVFQTQNS